MGRLLNGFGELKWSPPSSRTEGLSKIKTQIPVPKLLVQKLPGRVSPPILIWNKAPLGTRTHLSVRPSAWALLSLQPCLSFPDSMASFPWHKARGGTSHQPVCLSGAPHPSDPGCPRTLLPEFTTFFLNLHLLLPVISRLSSKTV